jgi:hypothetical protein
MLSVALDLHPFTAVTVTTYTPANVTVAFAELPNPLFHKYDAPPVAVNAMEAWLQVSVAVPELLVIPAMGAVVFWEMAIEALAVQPFEPVTVTV